MRDLKSDDPSFARDLMNENKEFEAIMMF